MTVRTVHIPYSRLKEGETYPFHILRTVELDPGELSFVLKDPSGYRFMMPGKYYKAYGFDSGKQIECRVDKINCKGKIFLEPVHPHYREGQVYAFELLDVRRCQAAGEPMLFLHVKDALGFNWEVPCKTGSIGDAMPEKVCCRVNRIKKGQLYLSLEEESIHHPFLKPGAWARFRLIGEDHDPEDAAPCYILQDEAGLKHMLKKKYYGRYGLATGQMVSCRVLESTAGGRWLLEPAHPCYETGQRYDFQLKCLEEQKYSDGYIQRLLVLLDCFGEELTLPVSDTEAMALEKEKMLNCLVKSIRKSRLTLADPIKSPQRPQPII